MLSTLFKPAWQSHSTEKRLAAISAMNSANVEDQKALKHLVEKDENTTVRIAALQKMSDPDTLFSLQKHCSDETVKAAARKAFLEFIGPKGQATESELRALAKESSAALDIAVRAPQADLRKELLDGLSKAQRLEALGTLEYGDSRSLIVNTLNSEDELVKAKALLRGRDKNAERMVRSKLEDIRTKARVAKEQHELADGICQKMEYLSQHISTGDWRPEFKSRYLATQGQWNDLGFEPKADLHSRYMTAQTIVGKTYESEQQAERTTLRQRQLSAEILADVKQLADHSIETLAPAWPKANSAFDSKVKEWDTLAAEKLPESGVGKDLSYAQSLHSTLEKLVEALADVGLTSSSDALTTEETKERLHRLRSVVATTKNAPGNAAIRANIELGEAISELQKSLDVAEGQHKDQLNRLHKRIHRLFGSTSRGELGRAKRELQAIIQAAEAFSGKDRAGLDERIAKASDSMAKMGDWKDFVTEPKFIALCESMEALIGDKQSPEIIAKKVKDLQSSWKSLGYSENADQHWERFKQAGDKAYEPCATFFGERKKTREANLSEREKIVASAENILATTDWNEQPDYKNIEQLMSHMMGEWKNINDVEHQAGQKQWQRFSQIRSEITAKLNPVYESNIAQKNQLIEQAKALSETELKEESLPRLQQLQTRWKQIGVTRRKEDQIAWKSFKAATDDVYEKIQGARQSKRESENQQLEPFRNISKKISVLASEAKDLVAADHTFEQLQSDYEALAKLPKELGEQFSEGLDKDFNRACERYAKARERLLGAANEKEMHAFAEKARLCTQLERLADGGADTDIQQVQSDINDVDIHDKRVQKRFAERISAALDANKAEATEKRRQLCIDLEIFLGVESPAEDKSLRMKTQLERMKQQGMGSNQTDKQQRLEQYQLDWFCMPGAEPNQQHILDERFNGLMNKQSKKK